MTVRDIPDLQRGGQGLGSVVFSESFLESSVNVQQKGKILIACSLITIDRRSTPLKKFDFHNEDDSPRGR